MSHVATVKTEVNDLGALKTAVEELGGVFVENQRTYRWYGRSMGDYPLPEGFTEAELGHCEHAIRVPGVGYEVGVVKKNGTYRLLYDFWGPGEGLHEKFGTNLTRLTQMYGVHKATAEAKRKGFSVRRQTLPGGVIRLNIGGMR